MTDSSYPTMKYFTVENQKKPIQSQMVGKKLDLQVIYQCTIDQATFHPSVWLGGVLLVHERDVPASNPGRVSPSHLRVVDDLAGLATKVEFWNILGWPIGNLYKVT